MRRSLRLVVLAAVAGLVVPTAVSQTAVSAVDQDLVVSATSGAAGTRIEVTSASCNTQEGSETFRFLSARLLSGTAPGEVLAGAAVGSFEEVATIVVPDWISPDDPAVIEAQCVEVEISFLDEEPPEQVAFAFDPVPFDVEAAPDAPVQARTYSRTALQAGQAFQVDGSGCFLEDASESYVDVAAGSDLSFRTLTDFVVSGNGGVDGDAFEVPTAMTDSGLDIGVSQTDDEPPVVDELVEVPTDLPAGTYTSISYCIDDLGTTLMYEPELIEITGDAPFADMDLVVPAESRTATVSGGSCTVGPVDALVFPLNLDALADGGIVEGDLARSGSSLRPQLRTTAGVREVERRGGTSPFTAARTSSWVLDEEPVSEVLTPDADGAWSLTEEATFDNGIVGAYASCGDPLADGFIYDPRAAVVAVSEPETTTTTTTTPAPAPANAVPGTPTYAG